MNSLIIRSNLLYFFVSVSIIVTSCTTIRLISDYDEITDKAVTTMQEKVSKFFVKLESNLTEDKFIIDSLNNSLRNNKITAPQFQASLNSLPSSYGSNKSFYQDVKVDLNTLKVRADAIDKNEITQQQIAELSKMIDKTESLHKLGFKSINEIKPIEGNFNTAFTAIIKLQLALKRGEKNSTTK